MPGDDGVTRLNDRLSPETSADPVKADMRNFYKAELWTWDDRIERMLFAGTSLDRARVSFPMTPSSGRPRD